MSLTPSASQFSICKSISNTCYRSEASGKVAVTEYMLGEYRNWNLNFTQIISTVLEYPMGFG